MTRSTPTLALLLVALASLVGIIVLAALGESVPDVLPAAALTAVGALAGATLPSPATRKDPQ